MTGDTKHIDEVHRTVENLVVPLEEAIFSPFNISKMSSWKMIMQDFNTAVQVGFRYCRSCLVVLNAQSN